VLASCNQQQLTIGSDDEAAMRKTMQHVSKGVVRGMLSTPEGKPHPKSGRSQGITNDATLRDH